MFLLFVAAAAVSFPAAAQQTSGTLKGTLTDDSGAIIPGAAVTLAGNGVQKAARTQGDGSYTFAGLAPGDYTVKAAFPGFTAVEKPVTVNAGATVQLPIQMAITAEKQEVTVKGEAGPAISVEPDNNATALVIKGDDLAALPDDPDDLADALQALAGPGAGPNGGSLYIDGFSGGQLPPKESIREIRINQNPFSAEFDRLGFGRIEILTKPGSDRYRGTLGLNDSNAVFNSRNPFVDNKPDFSSRMYSANLGGPINKRSSFFFDFNRRDITDNAEVLATFLDPRSLAVTTFNQAVVTPNMRMTIAPRVDYQLSTNHTLIARFEYGTTERDNLGVGGFNLPPPLSQSAYNQAGNNQNLMLTETAVLNPRTVNETRFQFTRNHTAMSGNEFPTIDVSQSFDAGGNQVGNAFDTRVHYELQNYTSIAHGTHTIRLGVRLRRESDRANSPSGFGGTFSFLGSVGPLLDANNQPVTDPATGQIQTAPLTSLEQYRRTLLFQGLGDTAAQVRALGGGASQFSISAGNPYASIVQYDAAPFIQDDWRVKPNLTVSVGLRYEIQTNVADHRDFAPRIGFAWAPGTARNGRQKTVIRGGFGFFYDRINESLFLNALRLNGVNQVSFTVQNPDFFPNTPPLAALTASQNSIFRVDPNLRSEYLMQSAIGVERQLPRSTTAAVTFTNTRALHAPQTVPINTPLPGTFTGPNTGVRPFGDAGNLFLDESGGRMKQDLMMVNLNTRFNKNISLQANYTLNYANDLPGTPTNPYDFVQDWGRSPLDRRHRFFLVGSIAAPLGLRLNPFLTLQSGAPYDVTLGRDIFGNTEHNARPAFAAGPLLPGQTLVPTPLGDFISYLPGQNVDLVPRDFLTGAGMVSANLRVGRTFGFGASRARGSAMTPGGGGGGGRGFGGDGGPRGGPGGGGMRMGPAGGGRGGIMGDTGGGAERRYSVTLSVMFVNILNHFNPSNYVGVISSPYFLEPRGVNTGFGGGPGGGPGGGSSANNRRVDMSIRFSF
ncbi:MAG: carboxypeptidase regulatory-like domain-containing protein [Acidobacteriia bacterium]|nr:carboxypeptidase regulatory-like domain-containing protein [Terriglobia bacterium]